MLHQPQLPAEQEFYPLEELFIAESPPNLWPTNQNSNFGSVRRVFCGELQAGVDILTALFLERFVATASGYLSRYERELGLPINPVGLTVQMRRTRIARRMSVGTFTRTARREIVESFIEEVQSLGAPTELLPPGIALTGGGVTLYNEGVIGSIDQYYTITEYVTEFRYTVTIDSDVAIDQEALQRDLEHFTPAGINFNIVRIDLVSSIYPSATVYPSSTTYP